MELLLNAMGEKLSLIAEPMDRDYDPLHMKSMKNRQPAERLALAISWNRTAGRLRRAGEKSRAQYGESG